MDQPGETLGQWIAGITQDEYEHKPNRCPAAGCVATGTITVTVVDPNGRMIIRRRWCARHAGYHIEAAFGHGSVLVTPP